MEKKRIAYIDVAKCIVMSMLIFDHTGNSIQLDGIYTYIRIWIASFHMPFFFIIYGMVASNRYLDNRKARLLFLDKKIRSLLIPYVLWCMIYSAGYTTNFFWGVLYGTNPSLGYAGTNSVLWFLPVMFVSTVLFQVLSDLVSIIRIRKKVYVWIVIIGLCACISLFLKKFRGEYGIAFGVDIAFTGTVFIILGYLLKPVMSWLYKQKKWKIFGLALILVFMGMLLAHKNPPDNFWATVMALAYYGHSYILFIIVACISTIAIVLISMLLENIRLLAWLGEGSLVIMAVHYILFVYTIPLCNKIGAYLTVGRNIALPVCNVFVCMLVCIPIILFVNHYASVLKGK